MRYLGSGLLAASLGAALVLAPLPATAEESVAYSSYAESQFVAGKNALGELVNIVGDGIEEEGASSRFPDGGEQFTESPLQALDRLTIPVGDTLLDSEIGAVGSYAQTGQSGLAYAASGAVTKDGIIHVGGESQPATSNATLALSGGALEPLTEYIADLRLELGAVTSQARYENASSELSRGYSLAGSRLVLEVPALAAVSNGLGAGEDQLPETLEISGTALCSTLLGILRLPDTACADLPELGTIEVSGLNAISEGIESTTDSGISFDLASGSIVVDLETLLKSLGMDLNNLPENTDLLNTILPALAEKLPELVGHLVTTVENLLEQLEVTVTPPGGGAPVTLPLDQLTGPLGDALGLLNENLQNALEQLADPLAGALDQLTEALASIAQILVNVPNEYAARYNGDAELSDHAASISALRVKLLAVTGEEGQLADLLLGNSLVDTAATQVPVCTTDCGGDDGGPGGGDDRGPGGALPRTGVELLAPVFFGGLVLLGLGYLLTGRRGDEDEDPLALS